MNPVVVFGLCGAALTAIGLYGFVAAACSLRRILSFNMMGSGAFLLFGALGARTAGPGADPVPQAMIITGIVVALSMTALALALAARLETLTRRADLDEDRDADSPDDA